MQHSKELGYDTKTLEAYTEMISGGKVDMTMEIISDNTMRVMCTILNFNMVARSWCNYRNCINNTNYMLTCKIVSENTVDISIKVRNSIDKSVCYSVYGVKLYKLYKRQVELDGRVKKITVGYLIEKEEAGVIYHIGLYGKEDKSKAKKVYRKAISEVMEKFKNAERF